MATEDSGGTKKRAKPPGRRRRSSGTERSDSETPAQAENLGEDDISEATAESEAAATAAMEGGPSPAEEYTDTGPPRSADGKSRVLTVALRGGRGTTAGRDGGDDLGAWVGDVVKTVLPRLPRWPSPSQFLDSIAGAPLGVGPAVTGVMPAAAGGAFAGLASLANSLEREALPAARDLRALTQDADLDQLEAERASVLDRLRSLVAELRQPEPDGPDKTLAEILANELAAHVAALGTAAEILTDTGSRGDRAVTPADFAQVSRFDVLERWTKLAQEMVKSIGTSTDPRSTIGRLKDDLAIVTEKARRIEEELDELDVGPRERARESVPPTQAGVVLLEAPLVSLARLLDWLQSEAGDHLPALLDESGRLAKTTIQTTLAGQEPYVKTLETKIDPPWDDPIVKDLVDDLSRYVDAALDEAKHL